MGTSEQINLVLYLVGFGLVCGGVCAVYFAARMRRLEERVSDLAAELRAPRPLAAMPALTAPAIERPSDARSSPPPDPPTAPRGTLLPTYRRRG